MKHIFSFVVLFGCLFATAQQQGFTDLTLQDMSGFQQQAGNWQVVGAVNIDPTRDIHHESEQSTKKKKKKKSDSEPVVQTSAGSGILVNLQTEDKKDNLLTSWEHGDLVLSLDVMMPKGSNSGIYLQGRYEIQLLDSWGVKDPKFSDIGGIYRNWESDPVKSYMGKAPLTNAAKAPGLWQHFDISFKAPKFDVAGNKIANAKIDYVKLNGVLIHENVEIPKLTGGPIGNEEVAKGPLMIQGDHGPVAFRNIKYKFMHDLNANLQNLKYEVYNGKFETVTEVPNADPNLTGELKALDWQVADRKNEFGIRYKAKLNVGEAAEYTFEMFSGGTAELLIDGKRILDGFRQSTGKVGMEAGSHDFELVYFKQRSWVTPQLGLTISSPTGNPKDLHSFSSLPPNATATAPILIEPERDKPRLLRAFLDFKGDRDQRITHSIGVGELTGMNYVYDLKSGNLVCVWKGDFVDATPMWHDRGDGSFKPLGMIQYLYNSKGLEGEDFRSKGYVLDDAGRPTFKYHLDGKKVTDKIYPDVDANKFIREVAVDQPAGDFKLAEGETIEQMSNGWYVVGDKQFYIELLSGQTPQIQEKEGKKTLVVPTDVNPIRYAIIW